MDMIVANYSKYWFARILVCIYQPGSCTKSAHGLYHVIVIQDMSQANISQANPSVAAAEKSEGYEVAFTIS